MSFRDCPKCKECDTTFFRTDEDFGTYEVLECSECSHVFSPQREEEKYRTLVNKIVFAVLSIVAGFYGLDHNDTIFGFLFIIAIAVGWMSLMILFTIYILGDEEPETSSSGPK